MARGEGGLVKPGDRLTWTDPDGARRTGVVWSLAPKPTRSSLRCGAVEIAGGDAAWVLPDAPRPGEAPAVYVRWITAQAGGLATAPHQTVQDVARSTVAAATLAIWWRQPGARTSVPGD